MQRSLDALRSQHAHQSIRAKDAQERHQSIQAKHAQPRVARSTPPPLKPLLKPVAAPTGLISGLTLPPSPRSVPHKPVESAEMSVDRMLREARARRAPVCGLGIARPGSILAAAEGLDEQTKHQRQQNDRAIDDEIVRQVNSFILTRQQQGQGLLRLNIASPSLAFFDHMARTSATFLQLLPEKDEEGTSRGQQLFTRYAQILLRGPIESALSRKFTGDSSVEHQLNINIKRSIELEHQQALKHAQDKDSSHGPGQSHSQGSETIIGGSLFALAEVAASAAPATAPENDAMAIDEVAQAAVSAAQVDHGQQPESAFTNHNAVKTSATSEASVSPVPSVSPVLPLSASSSGDVSDLGVDLQRTQSMLSSTVSDSASASTASTIEAHAQRSMVSFAAVVSEGVRLPMLSRMIKQKPRAGANSGESGLDAIANLVQTHQAAGAKAHQAQAHPRAHA